MTTPTSPPATSKRPTADLVKRVGLVAALAAVVATVMMPALAGLPLAGQMVLGILALR